MTEEKLDRRNFFRLGVHKVAKAAVDVAEARINQRASLYIRPPFAIEEFDFLTKCTRCHDCIEACPHQIIFSLSSRLGIEIVSTPALDLTNGACHLCQDWPCVVACEPDALKIPEIEIPEDEVAEEQISSPPQPRLAEVQIDKSTCLPYMGPECGVCGSVCPIPGAITWDLSKPEINKDICTGCAICRQSCITEPKAITITTIKREPQSD